MGAPFQDGRGPQPENRAQWVVERGRGPVEAWGQRGRGVRDPECGESQAGVLCARSPERDCGRGHQRLQAGLPEAELQTDPQAPQAAPGMQAGEGLPTSQQPPGLCCLPRRRGHTRHSHCPPANPATAPVLRGRPCTLGCLRKSSVHAGRLLVSIYTVGN